MSALGKITFTRTHDGMILEQHWNPDLLSRKDRDAAVRELRDIAAHIDLDEFEVNGRYERFAVVVK